MKREICTLTCWVTMTFPIGLVHIHAQDTNSISPGSNRTPAASGSADLPLRLDPGSMADPMVTYELIFDSRFDREFVIDPNQIATGKSRWRREDMGVSNNAGQHRQTPGRRHAAWYDRHTDQTAFIRDGVLVQKGFVANQESVDGFVSRDADGPRNHAYVDPDPLDADKGTVNFADFELHTSWLDTFALKFADGKQTAVQRSDVVVAKDQYWGQIGKTDTASPNITFSPATFFEIEVNFESMRALAHRHSFWLMPSAEQALAYDDDPTNGLEIDIYEHELAIEPDADLQTPSRNDILLMKCIGGRTTPTSTHNELRSDGGTAINVPGINRGWHRIGLSWTADELIWYVDGKAVVRDSALVPTCDMFLILSREANTGAHRGSGLANELQSDGDRIPEDAGLFGRNVATPDNLDIIRQGNDEVLVRSVRAWRIKS